MTYRLAWGDQHAIQPGDVIGWQRYESPWGSLVLWIWKDQLIRIFREDVLHTAIPFLWSQASYVQTDRVDAFFEALRTPTGRTLKACALGAPFEQAVWYALVELGDAHNITYQALAARAGSPLAARAVGSAMRRNPLPLLIPCHRVVSQKGMGGFQWGLDMKAFLQSAPPGVRVSLEPLPTKGRKA